MNFFYDKQTKLCWVCCIIFEIILNYRKINMFENLRMVLKVVTMYPGVKVYSIWRLSKHGGSFTTGHSMSYKKY